MITYISLLRGINVSGKNPLKMNDLKKMYQELGLSNVVTYIQSGNVLFQSKETDAQKLQHMLANQIKIDFGYDISIFVLSYHQLEKIILHHPFLKDESNDNTFFHLTFLSHPPQRIDHESILDKKLPTEQIYIKDEVVYLYCPNGYGKTNLSTTFLETKLKVNATTRNWKTTLVLFQLANEINV